MRSIALTTAWLPLFTLCAALLAAPGARAGAADLTPKPLLSAEARKWLQRIHTAAQEINYQGTLVFSADGALSSARVAHFFDGAQSFERVEVLDGRRQQTYRHNDRVYTLWPQSRVAVMEERDPKQSSLRQVIEPRAEALYEMREQGNDHVAGREAQVLLLSPRDELRFAQRLWIDSRTGLMLRADVLGPRHQVLESSAFSQVEIGVKAKPHSVLYPMKHLEGYRKVRPEHVPTQLESEGWTMKSLVPGFQLISSTRRMLDPVEGAAAPPPVLQAVYSDGLTNISLFVEPFNPERHKQPLLTQWGATHTLMQPHGSDWWVTVMGDAPAATLKQFYQALERRR